MLAVLACLSLYQSIHILIFISLFYQENAIKVRAYWVSLYIVEC